jgi:hypothetical protein
MKTNNIEKQAKADFCDAVKEITEGGYMIIRIEKFIPGRRPI